jgi:hypothetical protein
MQIWVVLFMVALKTKAPLRSRLGEGERLKALSDIKGIV